MTMIHGQIQPTHALRAAERRRMYDLMTEYFEQMTPTQFERDLAEKQWVFLLTDATSGEIQGFSTLLEFRVDVDGEPVVAFFSGDTIIARAYRGDSTLPRLWLRYVFARAAHIHDASVYWFLISSGYKTYRFLPVFFREFYPTCERPTPPHTRRILDAVAYQRFPTEYDADSGIVRLKHASPLRPGVADITPERLKDPHVAFFVAANPGYDQGDDLACLASLTRENLTAAGLRLLDRS